MNLTIRAMVPEHWPDVQEIYLQGIATGNATFETEAPDWNQWDAAHLRSLRLVAVRGSKVVGWAALSQVSTRCAYAGVAEVSVYVAGSQQGRGVGTALLTKIIAQSEGSGLWTLQAGIFPENRPSIALHRRCGFRVVGLRHRLGRLQGVWRDVLLMERRSTAVGCD